ncbi:Xaa-Pro peptidase family protein [Danxiaibacter flavus]|uniref:Xaa-Pro peptidase family protein n=1 Tax=Danxiaibacter flavus TaxID=3049108 RepID=A0ABV3ZJE9_9BACT|nr:Xaa-Pro peptidase family protein [Chitinophagaceae bacterium DXS]
MENRIQKLKAIQKAKKLDAFLITSFASLKYLSGYFFYFEHGLSPFQLLPAALVVGPELQAGLILADNETQQLPFIHPAISISTYESYVYQKDIDAVNQFVFQLDETFKQLGIKTGRLGVEPNALPASLLLFLGSRYPAVELVDITADIAGLRIIKDADEIALIRQSARLSDIGQSAVLRLARSGMSELELFNLVRRQIEEAAGTRVPLMADFVSGASTATGGGLPTNKIINEGDLILSDFTPCLNGYWGDSCSTIAVGMPTTEQQNTFNLVREALEIGINTIRPGVQAKEVDSAMRRHLQAAGNFEHHGGHGVGVVYHEEPRITPYNTMLLQPGMVIALEPAVYKDDFGIRLEHLVAVTDDGCEVLTTFNHSFEQQTQPSAHV